MINGHGDDIYNYGNISSNFSSNTYSGFCHDGLFEYIYKRMGQITNYPEADAATLEMELSRQMNLQQGEVMVTNGATEAIYLIAQCFRTSVSAIIGPTFTEYADACRIHQHHTVLLEGVSELEGNHQLVWLCNPNNPTGKVFPKEELETVINGYPDKMFVVDCSYAPFSDLPQIDSLQGVTYDNVLMLHSMTKRFAIPGLRLGYVTGPKQLVDRLRAQRMPWAVNQMAICAGLYLLAHQDDYFIDLSCLQDEVRYVEGKLNEMDVFEVVPTDCHFMLVRTKASTAAHLKEYLALNFGILIRDASNIEGLDASYFRIAVQSHPENEQLIKGIEQWKNSL